MIHNLQFRSANEVNSLIAQLLGDPFGFEVHPYDPRQAWTGPRKAKAVVFDLDSLDERRRADELVRAVIFGVERRPVALITKTLDLPSLRSLRRPEISIYRRLDEGVFHDLAWKIGHRLVVRPASSVLRPRSSRTARLAPPANVSTLKGQATPKKNHDPANRQIAARERPQAPRLWGGMSDRTTKRACQSPKARSFFPLMKASWRPQCFSKSEKSARRRSSPDRRAF